MIDGLPEISEIEHEEERVDSPSGKSKAVDVGEVMVVTQDKCTCFDARVLILHCGCATLCIVYVRV